MSKRQANLVLAVAFTAACVAMVVTGHTGWATLFAVFTVVAAATCDERSAEDDR